MGLEDITALIADDMRAVDRLIQQRLSSDVSLINHLCHYIVNSGGKRLRPMLTVFSARAFGYRGSQHINLAAIIEFIHTATLLHDDVVDASELRRGQETAHTVWGNEASILVGDFLYSRAFEMMVEVRNMRVMDIMSHATNIIAEGEILQLLNCNDAETTEQRYLEVIHCKTAKLFEAASRLGPVINNGGGHDEDAMAAYGRHLGAAYQLIDDVLDYSASSQNTGKTVGNDLEEGKPTLPLIYAMRASTPKHARIIRHAIESGGRENIEAVMEAIESSGALAYTARAARAEAQKASTAIADIPASPYKDALYALAAFSVNRAY